MRTVRLAPPFALLLLAHGSAAQNTGTADGNAAGAGGAVVTGGQTSTTNTVYLPYGMPGPGTNPDAHLPRGSQSLIDINAARNEFDHRPDPGTGAAVRGNATGAAVLPRDQPTRTPTVHQVKQGDTLWDLSAQYHQNPWMWPKVWSYNPHIQNPHWIYPGDELRVRPEGEDEDLTRGVRTIGGGASLAARRPAVPPDTVFLRNTGYIDDPSKDIWGELVGAREEQMLLSEGNNVYMILRPGADVRTGQLLTVFRPVRPPTNVKGARRPKGQIVSFKGTVRIDQWDPKTRVARGRLVESLDIVERGFKVGPVGRRFEVVAPTPSETDVWARVLTSIYPHEVLGQHQVAFIDKGSKDGLQPGNRLFIVERGDMWRKTLTTATKMARGQVRTDVPERVAVEYTPLHGDEEKFPEEIIGELRIVRTQEETSLAIVTVSHREIEPGDRAVARRGY
jgi:LysM repeat protein